MAKVDDSIRVIHLQTAPTRQGFSSIIEPKNVPAVFRGAVKNWEAVSKWDPKNGGLDYLEERAGSINVDAMLSTSAPIFYGDVQSHERVTLPFKTFVSSCKIYIQNMGISPNGLENSCSQSQVYSEDQCSTSLESSDQLYLAQVPIFSTENKEKSQLGILHEDIQTPVFLETEKLTSINLWMNRAESRSSTHYDPYNNLLCVVSGSKKVVLWPPSASPSLYPMPIHGESSNHSAVNLENPDFLFHPRASYSMEYSQTVILHPGDALFIPEGWYHQVDSDDVTIAVNIWWMSNMMSNMLDHMDAYYLRRILNRLVDKEMNSMLLKCLHSNHECCGNGQHASLPSKGNDEFDEVQNMVANIKTDCQTVEHLDPYAINILYGLISAVHDGVKVGSQNETNACSSLKETSLSPIDGCIQAAMNESSSIRDDPVAKIFHAIEPLVLKKVLAVMANQFPRTLEALILHALSPASAELLTRKFEEMDHLMSKEDQREFYQLFYSVFDDPNAAMVVIIKGKEAFAFQSLQSVMDKYLGLHI